MPGLRDNKQKPIVPILTGPTASGKSSIISILHEYLPKVQVISADSRQIYKYLNIGTDKPSKTELGRFPYHFVDFVEPGERFSVYDFVEQAIKIIGDIVKNGGRPIVCGGTCLYIKSLMEGMVEIPDGDHSIRLRLQEEAQEKGPEYLHQKLQSIDPQEASRAHPNNLKRIIRALEIYYVTGRPKSEIIANAPAVERPFEFDLVCLLPNRMRLYKRVDERVDRMLKNGLLVEAENLFNSPLKDKILETNVIGYDELFRYFDDKITLEEAINLIKQNTRRFAKRQITWFGSMKNIQIIETIDETTEYFLRFWGIGGN